MKKVAHSLYQGKIRLACVPEQVNIPVQIALESGIFEKHNIQTEVKWVPEGTGKMIEMMERDEVDIALTVADAMLVARSKQRNIQLCGCWVPSPLVWAIASSPKNSSYKDLKSFWNERQKQRINELRVGISRPGSGSQTMASYMAMVNGLHSADAKSGSSILSFTTANDFKNLRQGKLHSIFIYYI
jgi:ABC-type nitrate/sulfonate/bicarbonate transport system substrate-binding protein